MASKLKLMDHLSDDIANEVNSNNIDDINTISKSFDDTLNNALKKFNSKLFDNDGFIEKIKGINLQDTQDKEALKTTLVSLKNDYVDISSLSRSEILMRRDIYNICNQFPEMRDAVIIVRDGIIECNVSTGTVSRKLIFKNRDQQENDKLISLVHHLEEKYDLLMANKNFIIPRLLMGGEIYVLVTPYAKLFAELEAISIKKYGKYKEKRSTPFTESIPANILDSFAESKSLYTENNLKYLTESISPETKSDFNNLYKDESSVNNKKVTPQSSDNHSKECLKSLLENINVCNGSSIFLEEMGIEGFKKFVLDEYSKSKLLDNKDQSKHYFENITLPDMKNELTPDDINTNAYTNIKGAYVKYLNGLQIVPIRMDRKVVGYYYITTTMDLQLNPAQPNGIVDLSFQQYMKDKNMVEKLSQIIIKSFNKPMLEKNIKLKEEIAQIVMSYKFTEGKLSFIFIPENEIVRYVVNEDEEGKGHSMIEPSLFSARMFVMLSLYNVMTHLNNNAARIWYLRSSGLNKNISAQVQRVMRKKQSRNITIDDVYSYHGVLNKVGGSSEMIIPTGRADFKALEVDTLEAMTSPISLEMIELFRKQAISGTTVAYNIINSLDEVEFAKTLELANARTLSSISGYKIDCNKGNTLLYRKLLKYNTDLTDEEINSFNFQFNQLKQKELEITQEMITNFNAAVEVIQSMYFGKTEIEDKEGRPTPLVIELRKELGEKYLPQLDFEDLDSIVEKVRKKANKVELDQRVDNLDITKNDIEKIKK